MYDELVKRLRASVDNHHEKCDGCPYEEDYPCCVDCLDKMHKEAADAIEELQRFVEANKTSRWIPVEDHLPEEFVSVQAHMMDAGLFPSVREGYLAGGRWFFPALDEVHPVDRWRAFDTPEEDAHAES